MDESLISRQALLHEIDQIYDCADMVFEPNDHCCKHENCAGCRWWETKNYIRKMVARMPSVDIRKFLRRNTTMLNIGEQVFVVCKFFTESDKFKIYVATKEINRIERNKDGDIIYTAGKHNELRFHLEDGVYKTLGERSKTVYLNRDAAEVARKDRYDQEMAALEKESA